MNDVFVASSQAESRLRRQRTLSYHNMIYLRRHQSTVQLQSDERLISKSPVAGSDLHGI
jgi:hypothetical protein